MTKATTELTIVERAAVALGTAEHEKNLLALVKQSESIVEIKNNAAREQCHSAYMVLRTARTDIQKAGKTAREDATAFSKAVIEEEKRLIAITEIEETRLQGLRDAWDEAREAEKRAKVEAEQRRVTIIRNRINGIRAYLPTVVGQSSSAIENVITTLVALPVDVENFAELTGDAEFARGETLENLRAMHKAALEQEAKARRLAEENARHARERAEFEEEQRRAAAARAEQERKDAEARAAREAEERAQREREEVARREQQAREDAERRAAIEAEEKRLTAGRAEIQRRQEELDRADAEAREREEAAARETAAAAAREESERKQQAFVENLAARNAPYPTGGTWSIGKTGGCIVSSEEIAGCPGTGHNDAEYYGGNMICESVWRPADAYVLAAARDMFDLLTELVDIEGPCPGNAAWYAKVQAVLAKAIYVPEVQPEARAA